MMVKSQTNASALDGSNPYDQTTQSDNTQSLPSGSASNSFFSLITAKETEERLNTSLIRGLAPAEAAARLLEFGLNELPTEEAEPLWLRFLKQFKETLILLLLGSAIISYFMGNSSDAISISIAVTIVVTVGFVQEYRSEKSIESLSKMVPHFAHLIRFSHEDRTRPGSKSIDGAHISPVPHGSEVSRPASSKVLAKNLVQGDLVIFSTGDRIPADLRITESVDLSIDESNLTGENEPALKQSGVLDRSACDTSAQSTSPHSSPTARGASADIRLNEKVNIAFMGTLVRSGHGKGLVIGTGGHTEFGAISASMKDIESPRTPLQLSMDLLGQQLSYVSFAIITVIVMIGILQGREIVSVLQIGISLAVAAIPEGLPIIVTVTLALGVMRMSTKGAVVRRLPSVETLGSVNVICSDKTGTLTLNHMTITRLWHFNASSSVTVDKHLTSSAPDQATLTLLRIGNVANNARLSSDNSRLPTTASSAAILSSMVGNDAAATSATSRWVGQPTDVAVLDLLDAFGEDDVRDRIGRRRLETPFSSERKWMGVLIGPNQVSETNGTGTEVAYIKGALEQVLRRCDTFVSADGKESILDEQRRQEAMSAADGMAREGLRVLGFASGPKRDYSRIVQPHHSPSRSTTPTLTAKHPCHRYGDDEMYNGLVFAGIVGMNDPPRRDVDKAIRRLMLGGVKVIMITGDAETTALAIARKLGMPINEGASSHQSVIRGDELDNMSDEELAHAISGTSIFARTSPDHKMKIVRALQARGDIVAMTGDGVNDAPALKKANIGISMGILGTDVAKEAADMVLSDDNFSTILSAIEEGKGIFYNIQNFLTFQLSTSVAALSLVFFSSVLGFENPLNAMQILWINILMDGPPAQSLGVEPVDPAVMSRPPRSPDAHVITMPLIKRVLTSAGVIMLGTLLIYYREMSIDNTINARDTTMTFTCFVFFDMFNALTCRSEAKSMLRGELGIFENRVFNLAVGGSLLGQMAVIYLPFFQHVFQTEALYFTDLGLLLCIASTVFWVDEARKYAKSRSRRRRGLGGYSGHV